MNTIKPKHTTFEQSKWLKEKGFFPDVHESDKWSKMPKITLAYDENGNSYNPPMPRVSHASTKNHYLAPEQWQVVEWLRVNHGIWISVEGDSYGECWYSKLKVCSKKVWDNLELRNKIINSFYNIGEHKSPQEAYSAAFDYIKVNNLI